MISGGAQTGSAPGFFVSPLPLGATYVLSASRGFENTYSKPIQLDAAKPNPAIDLQFSRVWTATGQVLGPDRKPSAGVAVTLELRSPQQENDYEPPYVTGRDGRFEFRGLSTGIGPYWARVRPVRDFQPVDVELPEDGSPPSVQLRAGHVIQGRLINAGTGKALEGVEVFATPSNRRPTSPWRYEPERRTTGSDGEFRFSTLPEGTTSFVSWDRQVHRPTTPTKPSIRPVGLANRSSCEFCVRRRIDRMSAARNASNQRETLHDDLDRHTVGPAVA